jgi:hypothetical protein
VSTRGDAPKFQGLPSLCRRRGEKGRHWSQNRRFLSRPDDGARHRADLKRP